MSSGCSGFPTKRSAGALKSRRVLQPWPKDRDFRILAIDGGGIRGVFPAAVLAGLEKAYTGGTSVADYFDLIVGTSTGGIIALGLGAGLPAARLRDMYTKRGREIFPPIKNWLPESMQRRLSKLYRIFRYRYDREALANVLTETLGNTKFGDARNRLCIPSFEGEHGEVYIFKTPHHPDFGIDRHETMVKIGLATSAAPTFYRPLEDGGYTFVDGGIWANNPVMIGVVDALTCFDVSRRQIRILSLGCGETRYDVGRKKISQGGMWQWRDVFEATMRLQSQNALGQSGLLIGADSVTRVDVPPSDVQIELDDSVQAIAVLPGIAEGALDQFGESIATRFLVEPTIPYAPIF